MAKWDITAKLTNANGTTDIEHLETRTPDDVTEKQITKMLKKQLMVGYVKKVEITNLVRISHAELLASLKELEDKLEKEQG
jgi:hypothetical protein